MSFFCPVVLCITPYRVLLFFKGFSQLTFFFPLLLHRNVDYDSPIPLVAAETSSHKTFMDTLGRTTLKLTAMNVVDESRDKDLIVCLPPSPLSSFPPSFLRFLGAS